MIRRATAEDAAQCVDILRDWINETPWMPMVHSRDSMLDFWGGRLTEAEGWIAPGKGFALRDGDYLTALYLAAPARRQGLGSALLAKATQGHDTKLWTFQANTAAIAFYQSHGFQEIRRTDGDNEEGLPDILMARYSAAS